MAKISELTGEAREQRIAELKQKMQESALRVKAAHAAGELTPRAGAAPAAEAVAVMEAVEEAPVEEVVAKPAAEAPAAAKPTPTPAPAAPKPKPKPATEEVEAPAPTTEEMNRREFLTYAWGAAMGLLGIQAGVAVFMYLYPRFRPGEFGGEFTVPLGEVPPATAPPVGFTAGKFWMVTTEEGDPKAIYMVCTHLGCLYKWEPSTVRFECPCHGSKFSHDGFYIEGPAPRSLDYFDVRVEGDSVIVDTGKKNNGAPSTESPARLVPA